jgi:hypothetical protein
MKKHVVAAALVATIAVAGLGGCKPTKFQNCTELNKKYPGGVAIPGAVDHRSDGGTANYRPTYDANLYKANSGLDRDHDNIACEK